jgi:hypothetical protein
MGEPAELWAQGVDALAGYAVNMSVLLVDP